MNLASFCQRGANSGNIVISGTGNFGDLKGAESVGFSHSQFGLVVQALDNPAGELQCHIGERFDRPALIAALFSQPETDWHRCKQPLD
jgi:hypothetical protein